jgi:ankyrin repeat protein
LFLVIQFWTLCRHAAVSYGHDQLVKYLLENGADINLRDTDGDCPLLYCEDVQTLQLLIHYYNMANANGKDSMVDFISGIKNSLGQNILDKMIGDENEEMIAYLVNSGHKTGAGAALPAGFKIDLVDQAAVDNPNNLDGQGAFSLQHWQEQQMQEQMAAQEAEEQNMQK